MVVAALICICEFNLIHPVIDEKMRCAINQSIKRIYSGSVENSYNDDILYVSYCEGEHRYRCSYHGLSTKRKVNESLQQATKLIILTTT